MKQKSLLKKWINSNFMNPDDFSDHIEYEGDIIEEFYGKLKMVAKKKPTEPKMKLTQDIIVSYKPVYVDFY